MKQERDYSVECALIEAVTGLRCVGRSPFYSDVFGFGGKISGRWCRIAVRFLPEFKVSCRVIRDSPVSFESFAEMLDYISANVEKWKTDRNW